MAQIKPQSSPRQSPPRQEIFLAGQGENQLEQQQELFFAGNPNSADPVITLFRPQITC
jgi:hypothetical protein